MTDEDLGCKPGVVEKVKFEYSPLGKVFNKELNKKIQKITLKRLKNIEWQEWRTIRVWINDLWFVIHESNLNFHKQIFFKKLKNHEL